MSVYFKNPGLLDMRAATTFGVNVKSDEESAIGRFGTGMKYAIGIVLRLGGSFVVYVGMDRYEFIARPDVIRGKEFRVVHLMYPDGTSHPLGFTAEVGKDWEAWQAYRELRCNCTDEGGSTPTTSPRQPAPDTTLIVIDCRDVEQAHEKADEYFLSGSPMLELDGLDVHYAPPEQARPEIFYRGIRVGRFANKSRWTYNLTANMLLSEDRTLINSYVVDNMLANAVANATDEQFIEEFLTTDDRYMEFKVNFSGVYSASPQFLDVAERVLKQKPLWGNMTVRPMLSRLRNVDPYEWVDPNVTEAKMLMKAEAVVKELGFDTIGTDIRIVETLGPRTMGKVHGGIVYLSRLAFRMGTKQLAGTLFEEMVHHRLGYGDETRDFQNYLIDKLISMVEERTGEPL